MVADWDTAAYDDFGDDIEAGDDLADTDAEVASPVEHWG